MLVLDTVRKKTHVLFLSFRYVFNQISPWTIVLLPLAFFVLLVSMVNFQHAVGIFVFIPFLRFVYGVSTPVVLIVNCVLDFGSPSNFTTKL